jgi:hypothetical protein
MLTNIKLHIKCLENEKDKFQKSLSWPSIIDARAHYWAVAWQLRSTDLDNRLKDGGKVVSLTHQLRFTPQENYLINSLYSLL